jgi:hypothetical protein
MTVMQRDFSIFISGRAPNMKDTHRLLATALRPFFGRDGLAFPAHRTLAGILGWPIHKLRRALAEMESLGGWFSGTTRFKEGTRQHLPTLLTIGPKLRRLYDDFVAYLKTATETVKARAKRAFTRSSRPVHKPEEKPRPVSKGSDSPVQRVGLPESDIGSEEPGSEKKEDVSALFDKVRSSLGTFARRGRAPGCDLSDPEVRRQRRIQVLMAGAVQRLSETDCAAYWAIFMEADLPAQRRAMDRLEVMLRGLV